ncbi:MAG: hypothetical protein K9M84_11675 [Spirochaetia bacterium]|nr:hypothetical protein [Spirochaetia bacterium]
MAMSYEILLNKTKKLVVVVHHEEFAEKTAKRVLPEMMNILAFKQWNHVLIDFRALAQVDLFEFKQYIIQNNIHRALPRTIQMGILVLEHQDSDPASDGNEIRSKIEMRVFHSEDDALAWFV